MNAHAFLKLGAFAAAIIVCASAHAAFIGITLEGYTTTIGGEERNVYRVYANFSSPIDGVNAVGPIGTSMTLRSVNSNGQISGSFYGGSNPTPPTQDEIDSNPDVAHRSFYTINLTVQDQNPDPAQFPLLNVTMPPITSSIVVAPQDSGATVTTPNSPFALAGWSGQNRVLLLQLQVTCNHCVQGTIGLNTIIGGAETVIVATFPNLNGGGCIPAPCALALLAIAGASTSRRR